MKRKIIAVLLTLVLVLSLAACGDEEKETTLSGMVVSVEGNVLSLVEMSGSMEDMDLGGFSGEFDGTMPEAFEGNIPEGFDGTMPEGFEGGFPGGMPEDFDGTMPEGFDGTMPEGFEGEFPEGFEGGFPGGRPEDSDGTLPEGETYPQRGEGGMPGGMMGAFGSDAETTQVDVSNAHISVEIDGGKASGTLEDLQPGSFVTVTLNARGEATYVLVSEGFSFGGRGR